MDGANKTNIGNILQKLVEEQRIRRENTNTNDKLIKFIEDKRNTNLDMIKKSSLLCYGMFNQQFNNIPQN